MSTSNIEHFNILGYICFNPPFPHIYLRAEAFWYVVNHNVSERVGTPRFSRTWQRSGITTFDLSLVSSPTLLPTYARTRSLETTSCRLHLSDILVDNIYI